MMYGQAAVPVNGYMQQPPADGQGRTYAKGQAATLGVIQILAGIFSIGFNAVAIAIDAYFSYMGSGFWAGILFIIAGSLGFASSKDQRTGLLVGTMVMSILAAVFTTSQITQGAIGYDSEDYYYNDNYYYYSSCSWWTTCTTTPSPARTPQKAMHVILIVLALVEAIAAIWQSALPCAYYCCCNTPKNRVMVVQPNAGGPSLQTGQMSHQMSHQHGHMSSVFVVQGAQPQLPPNTVPAAMPASQVIHPQVRQQMKPPQPPQPVPAKPQNERTVPVNGQPIMMPNGSGGNMMYYPVHLMFSPQQPEGTAEHDLALI